MGPLPSQAKCCPFDAIVSEETDCGAFVRRQITFAAEPGDRVPGYLLVPKPALRGERTAPAILALHQTHPLGCKVVVGLGQSPDDEYGVELAQRGYIVLALAYPLLADYHPDLRALGYPSGTMKAIWNNRRGLDFLSTLRFVRTNAFGVIGHSLGGHNGVYTAVFDERLRVIVSSCGLDSYRDYMDGNLAGWTSERYMPRLRNYALTELPFDFHEMVAALAPRVCFLSAPLGDTNFKWRSVDDVARVAQTVYTLLGVPQSLRVEHPDCGHRFPPAMREVAYRLFDQHLR
jgi:pimeloyl-ACP methyl ester carboxylesterase